MKKSTILLYISILSLVLLTACGKTASASAKKSGNREQKSSEVSVVTYTIELSDLAEYAEISGKLEGISEVSVISEVSGKIISISKGLGDSVESGEEIARIDNGDIEAKLAQAKAGTLAAKANFDSESIKHQVNAELYEKTAISEVEFILSKSAFETAKANYDGAKASQMIAERNYDNSRFTASVTGKIAILPISLGQYIPIGTEVAKIIDDSKMIIRTGVGPSLIQRMTKGDVVELAAQLSDQSTVGIVTGIGLTPGSDNFNYPLEIEVVNDQNLLSGQLVKGKIKIDTYEGVIAITPSSVISYYDKKIVYVLDENSRVSQRKIKIYAEVSERCIVESGLFEGDQLIIQGQDSVKDGLLVKSKSSSDILDLTQLGD